MTIKEVEGTGLPSAEGLTNEVTKNIVSRHAKSKMPTTYEGIDEYASYLEQHESAFSNPSHVREFLEKAYDKVSEAYEYLQEKIEIERQEEIERQSDWTEEERKEWEKIEAEKSEDEKRRDAEEFKDKVIQEELGYEPVDLKRGGVCVPCNGGLEPCCVKSGYVLDKTVDKQNRKIEWPISDGEQPKTLLVIANEIINHKPATKVDLFLKGNACQLNKKNLPGMLIRSDDGFDDFKPISDFSSPIMMYVIYQKPFPLINSTGFGSMSALAVTSLSIAMGLFETFSQLEKERSHYLFTPYQCGANSGCFPAFKVVPFPQFDVKGKVEWAMKVRLSPAVGIVYEHDLIGDLSVKIGAQSFNLKKELIKWNAGVDFKKKESHNKIKNLKGKLRFLSLIANTIFDLGKAFETKNKELAKTKYASYVEFFAKVEAELSGIKLEEKFASPDLYLTTGSAKSSFTGGVNVKFDFLQEVVTKVLKIPASKVAEIRYAAAKGETVKGELSADLIGTGQWKAEANLLRSLTLTIPAEGDFEFDLHKKVIETKEFNLIAKAEIKAMIGIDVYVFSAEVGLEGSLHTSWNWEFREFEDGKKRRFYFEGLYLKYKTYKKIGGAKDKANPKAVERAVETSGEETEGTLFENIENEIDKANEKYESMSESQDGRSESKFSFRKPITILYPTVRNKDVNNPAWEPDD